MVILLLLNWTKRNSFRGAAIGPKDFAVSKVTFLYTCLSDRTQILCLLMIANRAKTTLNCNL